MDGGRNKEKVEKEDVEEVEWGRRYPMNRSYDKYRGAKQTKLYK